MTSTSALIISDIVWDLDEEEDTSYPSLPRKVIVVETPDELTDKCQSDLLRTCKADRIIQATGPYWDEDPANTLSDMYGFCIRSLTVVATTKSIETV